MNRPIKFRVFDKEKKEMCPVLGITWPIPIRPEISELMQFTGLLDSKGVEIWEGDIVRYDWAGDESPESRETLKVWFGEKGVETYYKCIGFWLGDEGGWPDAGDMEVIGNIFENSEMVK